MGGVSSAGVSNYANVSETDAIDGVIAGDGVSGDTPWVSVGTGGVLGADLILLESGDSLATEGGLNLELG